MIVVVRRPQESQGYYENEMSNHRNPMFSGLE
jgi:hypothetical protein